MKGAPTTPRPIRAFISYAREDRQLMEELRLCLMPYVDEFNLVVFTDEELQPYDPWRQHLKTEIEDADIFVQLLSPHSLASCSCKEELGLADQRKKARSIEIVLVLVRACAYHIPPIGERQVIKPGGVAVKQHPDRDVAWKLVTDVIEQAIKRILLRH